MKQFLRLTLALAAFALGAPASAQEAAHVVGDITAGFSASDYPPEALRNREEGRAVAEIEVAVDGSARGCEIAVSSGSPSLDAATCRRAVALTFAPARDKSGKPLVGRVTVPVRWVLPKVEWADVNMDQVTVVLDRISFRCSVEREGVTRTLGSDACRKVVGPRDVMRDTLLRSKTKSIFAIVPRLPDRALMPLR